MNSWRTITTAILISFHTPLAWSLMGGENHPVPPALCQIIPLKQRGPYSSPAFEHVCSALIVGAHQLRTAGHCGFIKRYQKYFVDCASGEQKILDLLGATPKSSWSFLDPEGAISIFRKEKWDLNRTTLDQALITTDQKFSTPAQIEDYQDAATIKQAILKDQCYLTAAGTTEAGQSGLPQAKRVSPQQLDTTENEVTQKLIVLKGSPLVAAHDSGGALICNEKVVGTILAQAHQKYSYIASIEKF